MKITHNITLSVNSRSQAEFSEAGMELGLGFQNFKIQETDSRWTRIKFLVDKYSAVDLPKTEFSGSEYQKAAYLAILPSWHFGYPMPDDDFGFLQGFDRSNFCPNCGVGLKQITAFRILGEPQWGSRSILQLNWILDEYFVKPDVWRYIFEQLGIECMPVLRYRDNTELKSIVQLRIKELVSLQLDGFPYEVSSCCGHKKYLPVAQGFLPKPEKTDAVLFKSEQYFGSGGSAFRLVLTNHVLFRKMTEGRVKGIKFAPCLS